MRRSDKEITGEGEKLAIIARCKICRLGMADGDQPYVTPLNYGYTCEADRLTLFFHGAREGRKIDVLKKNNRACFEIDCDDRLIEGKEACSYGFAFKSVIGFGVVKFAETREETVRGLSLIMRHQTGREAPFAFNEDALGRVLVYRLEVDEYTGKQKLVSR